MRPTARRFAALLLLFLSFLIQLTPVAAQTSPGGDNQPPPGVPGKVVVDFLDDDHLSDHADDSADDGADDGAGDLPGGNPELARKRAEAQRRADEIAREIRLSRDAGRPADGNPPGFAAAGLDVTAGAALLVGGITVAYHPTYPTPAYARAAIEDGIAAWGGQLSTGGAPVTVEVSWVTFGDPGVLGFAGPTEFFYLPARPTHAYPAALANVLTGGDVNGPATPEITVALNSELDAAGAWYYGSGTPPPNQVDLTTVVTHEMGHGVGFVSSASDTTGSIELASPPFVYDSLVSHDGVSIENVADVGAALTSGRADIGISTSQQAPLFVPPTWYQGTSASHFLNSGPTRNSLMGPSLESGTTSRVIDGYTLGVLELIGWPVLSPPIRPNITSVSVDGTTVTLEWTNRNITTGLPADRYDLEAYQGTSRVAKVSVPGSSRVGIIGGLSPNSAYDLRVIPINDARGPAAVTTIVTGDGPIYGQPDEIPPFVDERWLDHQVFRVYQAHFLRAPDRAGFDFWLDQRARGVPLLAVIAEFQAGSEFVNRYGSLSAAQFVQLVYRNVLGREADGPGFNHWTGLLAAGLTRAEMMLEFVESTEYIRRTATIAPHSSTEGAIRRLYQAYFLREPVPESLSYWVGVAESGTSLPAISAFFADSTEFTNRYGNLSDAGFVNLVYANVLGRAPDGPGFDHWTGQLATGVTRGAVMLGFSESVEFIKSTGTIP